MLPELRHRIKSDAAKNRSLKDILSSSAKVIEIISVEELDYHVYNTKVIALVEEDEVQEERVLIYNRLAINELLSGVSIVSEEIEDIILDLNELGFDFTEDDLELVSGKLKAKPTSLGYYNKVVITTGVDHVYASSDLGIVSHVIINGEVVDLNVGADLGGVLAAKGISVYDSYESYGCWSLGRYQNTTDQVLDVVVVVDDVNYGFGLSYLQPQDNQTITGMNNEGLEEGYRQLNFTLHPDTTHLPEPDLILFHNEYPFQNTDNVAGSSKYSFTVDDEIILNPNGGNLFDVKYPGVDVSNLLTGLGSRGVLTSISNSGSGFSRLRFKPTTPGRVIKMKINQVCIQPIDGTNRIGLTYLFGYAIVSPTEISVEFYLYDPIDLE